MRKESELRQRLIEFCNSEKLSRREFAMSVGKDPSYVSTLGKSMQTDVLESIAVIYPRLSLNWLITGKGEMYITETRPNTITVEIGIWDTIQKLADGISKRDSQIDEFIQHMKK